MHRYNVCIKIICIYSFFRSNMGVVFVDCAQNEKIFSIFNFCRSNTEILSRVKTLRVMNMCSQIRRRLTENTVFSGTVFFILRPKSILPFCILDRHFIFYPLLLVQLIIFETITVLKSRSDSDSR